MNMDGDLTDAELEGLALWIDDGDAILQESELKTLAEMRIESVSIQDRAVINGQSETLIQSEAILGPELPIGPIPTEFSTNGDDFLVGTDNAERERGRRGDDTMEGGAGNDTLLGDKGDDELWGQDGIDILIGGTGEDAMWGGDDRDKLLGGKGDDTLWGEDGKDIINGGKGDDILYGGADNDIFQGGKGDDTIIGGNGNDLMNGGSGDDTFVFEVGSGTDTITGFDQGDDLIDLTALSLDDLSQLTFTDTADGIELAMSGGDLILLAGTQLSDFDLDTILL